MTGATNANGESNPLGQNSAIPCSVCLSRFQTGGGLSSICYCQMSFRFFFWTTQYFQFVLYFSSRLLFSLHCQVYLNQSPMCSERIAANGLPAWRSGGGVSTSDHIAALRPPPPLRQTVDRRSFAKRTSLLPWQAAR